LTIARKRDNLQALNLKTKPMLRYWCLFFIVLSSLNAGAQANKIDSFQQLLKTARQDSHHVTWLWKLAEQYQFFKPDTTLKLAQQALFLARKINYTEGESRSLAIMATGQYLLGNYAAALNNYTQKLQIEEKRSSVRNYASALNNIGLMYILLNEYNNALGYLRKADSTLATADEAVKKELRNSVLVNTGEAFYRLKQMDAAAACFSSVWQTAINNADAFYQGTALLGLANVQAGNGRDSAAMDFYYRALPFLNNGTNNDMLCEMALGMASLFAKRQQPDSALRYAKLAYTTGKQDGFLSRELDAAAYISSFYKKQKKYDSAFLYMEQTIALQDSLKGQVKTREAMMVSSNEQLRQAELAEQKRQEAASRLQLLQVLGICIFIPLFFLLTLALSRVRLPVKLIRFMGVVSLLMVFEFLVLLLHPVIGEMTHHNKILELLILVIVGAGLVPLHHRLEKLVLTKLTKPRLPKTILPVQETNAATDEFIVEEDAIAATSGTDSSSAKETIVPDQENAPAANAAEADQSS
jgi:tetratricopeptide (TPR) repeat protein